MERCELCDGRIVNNRCQDCGMDYSRRKIRYQLNTTSHADDAAAVRKVMQAGAADARRARPGRTAGQSKETRSQNLQKQAAAAAGRKVTAEELRKRKADYKKRHKYYDNTFGKEKKKKSRAAMIVFLLILAALVVMNIMDERADRKALSQDEDSWYESSSYTDEFDESVLEGLEDYYSTAQEVEEKVYALDDADGTSAPTPEVTEEVPAVMPAEGEAYSVELSPGRYVGGQQLPVGTYEISLVSDEYAGAVILTDMKNGVFESAFMAAEEEYGGESTVRDYQLFEGGVLEIGSGEILVTASTQNAQMDTLQEGMPNPLTESFDLTYGSRLEVGVDIPAGTYDARHLSGLGTLEITDQDGGGYSAVMLTDSLTGDERAHGYRNLLLEKGQILSVADYSTDDFKGQLVPSETVYETEK